MYDALRGILPDPVGEGTHFLIPGLQKAHIMSVRAMPKEVKSRTGTKDLQNVNIALRILSRPKEAALPKIFDTLGVNFNDRILPSVVNEVLKSIVAKYNAEELLSKRSLISAEIKAELEKRANAFDLELVDVAITVRPRNPFFDYIILLCHLWSHGVCCWRVLSASGCPNH